MAWVRDKRKQPNDQKIAACGSSCIGTHTLVGAAAGCDLLILKKSPVTRTGLLGCSGCLEHHTLATQVIVIGAAEVGHAIRAQLDDAGGQG
jgi:uncharacterized protein YmfQ (DUF2313 family)